MGLGCDVSLFLDKSGIYEMGWGQPETSYPGFLGQRLQTLVSVLSYRACQYASISFFVGCWAGVAELADALDSKSSDGYPSWGFDPPLRHQESD